MHKWLIAGLAVLSVAIAGPLLAIANAKTKRTCSVDLVSQSVGIAVLSGNPPNSGSGLDAGILNGTICGKPLHGAIRDTAHFPILGKVNGTGTIFGPQGSMTVRFQQTATLNPNHSATLQGTSTITGGTGLYKGASGSGSLTGSQAPNSDVTTQHLTGTITY
jgi:hypothetical protein